MTIHNMMSKVKYNLEYTFLAEDNEQSHYRIVIPFTKIAYFTVALPFFGFIVCVIWSIIYNFEHATSTHCQVYNVLPSISAAIGHYRPQRDIWKTVIAAQAFMRALIFFMYRNYYQETAYHWAQGIINFTLFTYALENISLVTLSFWTSNENYAFHKLSFIIFLIMSCIHMCLTCYIGKECRHTTRDIMERISISLKMRIMIMNVLSILLACYFFWRHNAYCEPLEYLVVLTNMGFHLTAAWDFAGRSLLISKRGIRIL
ncbi:hypothetical protein PV328_008474 [Microctonus aethiopoides]|uniref:CWH43-like N-terminal domain-containing protein n=1 Tax=Microctonus aethiopoides TaxID=144406 RepID=A0AA39FJB3_9HYME|nr:hypothetical protein PV328_008474 [Microctonus aethiopoides]